MNMNMNMEQDQAHASTGNIFIAYDPQLADELGPTTALMLAFIRFRTRGRRTVEDGGLRWAQVTVSEIAQALHTSKRTVQRAFKAAAEAGLVETRSDGRAGAGRIVACSTPVVEKTAPGCWLAGALAGDMGNPADGIWGVSTPAAAQPGRTAGADAAGSAATAAAPAFENPAAGPAPAMPRTERAQALPPRKNARADAETGAAGVFEDMPPMSPSSGQDVTLKVPDCHLEGDKMSPPYICDKEEEKEEREEDKKLNVLSLEAYAPVAAGSAPDAGAPRGKTREGRHAETPAASETASLSPFTAPKTVDGDGRADEWHAAPRPTSDTAVHHRTSPETVPEDARQAIADLVAGLARSKTQPGWQGASFACAAAPAPI